MGFFDSIGKIGGTVSGGIAGAPAGIFGMAGGGLLGNKLGGMLGSIFDGGSDSGGDYYSGMSQYPNYVGMEGDQSLSGQFMGGNAPMDKFTQEAMRNGPSQGTKFALQQNALGANRGREQARKMAGGMAADAEANLSMKGGLGSGASERIQKQAGNAALDFSNAADASAGANRANLLIADEGARMGNLGQAGNMVQGQRAFQYGMKSDDMKRKQAELDRQNAFNMNNYNTQMQAWGAGKQAQATANSGKK